MDVGRFIREVAGSAYYRKRPIEVFKFGFAKYRFSRYRVPTASEMLAQLGFDPVAAMTGFEQWRDELRKTVHQDSRQLGIPFEGGKLLYGIVRCIKPELSIETGIAGGISSSFILAALIENRSGTLFSIDLPPEESSRSVLIDGSDYSVNRNGVGWLIPARIREYAKDRHVIVLENVTTALPKLLEQLQRVDFFFHDDLHTPDHMHWQYNLVWRYLAKGGVLGSDDINSGWMRFCNEKEKRNGLLNLMRIGMIRKS